MAKAILFGRPLATYFDQEHIKEQIDICTMIHHESSAILTDIFCCFLERGSGQ